MKRLYHIKMSNDDNQEDWAIFFKSPQFVIPNSRDILLYCISSQQEWERGASRSRCNLKQRYLKEKESSGKAMLGEQSKYSLSTLEYCKVCTATLLCSLTVFLWTSTTLLCEMTTREEETWFHHVTQLSGNAGILLSCFINILKILHKFCANM